MYVWSIPGWPRITVFKTSICWSLDWCESIKTGPHVRTSRAGIVLSTLRMIPAGSRWTLIGPTLAAKGSRGGSNCPENPWEQRSGNLILCQGHGKWFFSYLLLLHQRKVNDYNILYMDVNRGNPMACQSRSGFRMGDIYNLHRDLVASSSGAELYPGTFLNMPCMECWGILHVGHQTYNGKEIYCILLW